MVCIPAIGEKQEVSTNQFSASVCSRLVDNDLRTCRVEHTTVHYGAVHIVQPHRSRVGSTHTTELERISFALSLRHIFEALGRAPDNFQQRALLAPLLGRLFLRCLRACVSILRKAALRTSAQNNDSDHGMRRYTSTFHHRSILV